MTSRAVRTAARVASEMPGFPFRTRLTVASETPACFATSASLPATLQDYCKILQGSRRPLAPSRTHLPPDPRFGDRRRTPIGGWIVEKAVPSFGKDDDPPVLVALPFDPAQRVRTCARRDVAIRAAEEPQGRDVEALEERRRVEAGPPPRRDLTRDHVGGPSVVSRFLLEPRDDAVLKDAGARDGEEPNVARLLGCARCDPTRGARPEETDARAVDVLGCTDCRDGADCIRGDEVEAAVHVGTAVSFGLARAALVVREEGDPILHIRGDEGAVGKPSLVAAAVEPHDRRM